MTISHPPYLVAAFCALLIPCGALLAAASDAVCDPKALGAKADGRVKDTRALQAAIDQCAARGGGIVRLTPGTYLSAPLSLKSHVTLEVQKGATLLGSTDFDDYPVREGSTWVWQGVVNPRPMALVDAVGQTDITITGDGTIDGAGAAWWKPYREKKKAGVEWPRPWLVQFTRCERVVVENVTLQNSPAYTLTPFFCRDVTLRNIRIFAPPETPNTDGIAPYSSHHVRISHCLIDVGDDNVAIKSCPREPGGPDSSSSDITVSDCTFLHGHGATIGADTGGGVHDVLMENLKLDGTTNGLRIKSGRGFAGEVYNITYRNIVMMGADPAIAITAYYPSIPKQDSAKPVTGTTPRFHDITFSHVKSTGARDAGVVVGLPEMPITNLVLEDVDIASANGLEVRNATVVLQNSQVNVIERENAKIVKKER